MLGLSLLQGRFTIAAKHHITIAEIYEAELVDIEKVPAPGAAAAALPAPSPLRLPLPFYSFISWCSPTELLLL